MEKACDVLRRALLKREFLHWVGSLQGGYRPIENDSSLSNARQYAIAHAREPLPFDVLRLTSSNGPRCPRLKPLFGSHFGCETVYAVLLKSSTVTC